MHHVGFEGPAPRLFVVLDGERGDVRYDNVDAAERLGAVANEAFERRLVCNVNRRAVGPHALLLKRGDRGSHLRCVARADRDIGAFRGESLCDLTADAFAAASDDRVQSLQTQIHIRPPSSFW